MTLYYLIYNNGQYAIVKEELDSLPSYWENGWNKCLIMGPGQELIRTSDLEEFNAETKKHDERIPDVTP